MVILDGLIIFLSIDIYATVDAIDDWEKRSERRREGRNRIWLRIKGLSHGAQLVQLRVPSGDTGDEIT